jgi:peptide/nickel transport system substrate-binding protein
MYVWFYGTSGGGASPNPVNFNHINDPQLNQDLDQGRAQPDAAQRKTIYEDYNKRLTSQFSPFWGWYTPWFITTKPNIHGILGPNLPDADGKTGSDPPTQVLAGYHQMLGIWKG